MNSTLCKAAFFGDIGPAGEILNEVYGAQRMEQIGRQTALYPVQITSANIEQHLPKLRDLEVIFSTWGMLKLTARQLDQLPNLRAVFYAAGSVKYFAGPLLERGIAVVSAAAANAVPVAEFIVAQILLANKGYFRNVRDYRETDKYLSAFRGRGNFGATVSILGAGTVGREVIRLLRPFKLKIIVFDPFLSQKGAEALHVEKVDTLKEAFAGGNVVSNHLADVRETQKILNGSLFAALPKDAVFINTGRGLTVDHDDVISELRLRPDVTALLDVTEPEPLPLGHSLRALPNVHISGHIAGSIGDEVGRIADLILEEFQRWQSGERLCYAVSTFTLDRMA